MTAPQSMLKLFCDSYGLLVISTEFNLYHLVLQFLHFHLLQGGGTYVMLFGTEPNDKLLHYILNCDSMWIQISLKYGQSDS